MIRHTCDRCRRDFGRAYPKGGRGLVLCQLAFKGQVVLDRPVDVPESDAWIELCGECTSDFLGWIHDELTRT